MHFIVISSCSCYTRKDNFGRGAYAVSDTRTESFHTVWAFRTGAFKSSILLGAFSEFRHFILTNEKGRNGFPLQVRALHYALKKIRKAMCWRENLCTASEKCTSYLPVSSSKILPDDRTWSLFQSYHYTGASSLKTKGSTELHASFHISPGVSSTLVSSLQ